MIRYIKKYWFFGGLILAVLLGYVGHSLANIIQAKILQKYIAVPLIFLISGLTLKTQQLVEVLLHQKALNGLIQGFSLVFIPFFIWILVLVSNLLPHFLEIYKPGLIILGTLPTTVSSCVVLTKTAGGNEIVSVVNAAFGNLIGVVISPLYLLFMLPGHDAVRPPIVSVVLSISLTVLLPLVIGQLIRKFFPKAVERFSATVDTGIVNNLILLFMVWTTFSITFSNGQSLNFLELLGVAVVVLCLHFFFLGSSWGFFGLSWLGFSRKNRVAALFCSTQKTVAVGIPFISILFEGTPNLGLLSLPLLIYHPAQLIIAAFLTNKLLAYTSEESETPLSQDSENEESASLQPIVELEEK